MPGRIVQRKRLHKAGEPRRTARTLGLAFVPAKLVVESEKKPSGTWRFALPGAAVVGALLGLVAASMTPLATSSRDGSTAHDVRHSHAPPSGMPGAATSVATGNVRPHRSASSQSADALPGLPTTMYPKTGGPEALPPVSPSTRQFTMGRPLSKPESSKTPLPNAGTVEQGSQRQDMPRQSVPLPSVRSLSAASMPSHSRHFPMPSARRKTLVLQGPEKETSVRRKPAPKPSEEVAASTRLISARQALAANDLDHARLLLELAETQLVFQPALAADAVSGRLSTEVTSQITRALGSLNAGQPVAAMRYVELAIAGVMPERR